MSWSVRSGVLVMAVITLLTLPEPGFPQCYRPNGRSPGFVAPPCCAQVSTALIKEAIASCYEQQETTFPECKTHAFIFISVNNSQYCVNPSSTWLKKRFQILERRGICCQSL